MTFGSANFAVYERNLRRLQWMNFIESQMQHTRRAATPALLSRLSADRPAPTTTTAPATLAKASPDKPSG